MKNVDDSSSRAGLPSGSSAKRYKNCPGSFMRERELASANLLVDDSSEISKEGTLLHAVMAGKLPEIGLSDRHGYLIRSARRLRDKAISVCGFNVTTVLADSEREWLTDPDDPDKRLGSGLIDFFAPFYEGDLLTQALMIDWKFGPKGADDAEDNDQLDWYVAIKKQKHPELERLVAGIVQPAVEGDSDDDRLTLVEYDDLALRDNLQRVIGLARGILKKDQPCYAGMWCKNCPSIGRCETAAGVPLALGMTAQMLRDSSNEAQIQYRDSSVSPKELDLFDLAEWVIEARRGVALEQLRANPNCIEGWGIPNPTARSWVDNTKEALDVLSKTYPHLDFTPALKLSVTDAITVVKAHYDMPTSVAGKRVRELLGGCISTTYTTPRKPQKTHSKTKIK